MECMESYIVRIYRRGEGGDGFVGIVEKPEKKTESPFHSIHELAAILKGDRETTPGEKRFDRRLKINLPALVKGADNKGKNFSERATISDISSRGAYLLIKKRLRKDNRLQMVIDPDCSCLEISCRVARLEDANGGSGAGVLFE